MRLTTVGSLARLGWAYGFRKATKLRETLKRILIKLISGHWFPVTRAGHRDLTKCNGTRKKYYRKKKSVTITDEETIFFFLREGDSMVFFSVNWWSNHWISRKMVDCLFEGRERERRKRGNVIRGEKKFVLHEKWKERKKYSVEY